MRIRLTDSLANEIDPLIQIGLVASVWFLFVARTFGPMAVSLPG